MDRARIADVRRLLSEEPRARVRGPGTSLFETGAELIDIQTLLGHVELATTQIYIHVSEDRIAKVVAKLEEPLQIPRVTPGPPMSTNLSIGGIPAPGIMPDRKA